MKQDLCALLRGNPYPGRGIVLGMTPDGKSSVAVYSSWAAAPQPRLRGGEPDGIRTQAADARTPASSSTRYGRWAGTHRHQRDQTDTILEFLKQGLRAGPPHEIRADGPNWTRGFPGC